MHFNHKLQQIFSFFQTLERMSLESSIKLYQYMKKPRTQAQPLKNLDILKYPSPLKVKSHFEKFTELDKRISGFYECRPRSSRARSCWPGPDLRAPPPHLSRISCNSSYWTMADRFVCANKRKRPPVLEPRKFESRAVA